MLPTDAMQWFTLYLPLFILWGGIALHLVLAQPAQGLRQGMTLIALRLQQRVLHTNTPPSQQQLAGLLSTILLLIPIALMLFSLSILVWSEALFHVLLLWLAFDFACIWPENQRLRQALHRDQKHTARTLLAEKVQRDTDTLSLLGLGKAGAETLLQGYLRGLIHVLIWFMLGGGIAALLYRVCQLLARAWSPLQPQCYYFGRFVTILVLLAELPGTLLFVLLFIPGKKMLLRLRRMHIQAKGWAYYPIGALYTQVGLILNIAMGGPVRYQGVRVSRPTLGGLHSIQAAQLLALMRQLQWRALIVLLFTSVWMLL
ncbi:MAG: cobalamin biosynthesis protein [Plesiomonas sp.]|uniref:cobalamin biosynthesis protein n=1 Tax=Plesiomonas sp. TaxID=2486279 RepID=UPI003F3A9736